MADTPDEPSATDETTGISTNTGIIPVEGGAVAIQGEDAPEGDSDADSAAGEELVVLDPEHPLMKRFQDALQSHLEKQNYTMGLDLRELGETLKKKGGERESLGVELYGIQQELARQQMFLESCHDELASMNEERLALEQELSQTREKYKNTMTTLNDENNTYSELQQEVENLNLKLFYMTHAETDVHSDISVMKRVAEKAEVELTRAEAEKQKQDLFVDRLTERSNRLKEDISMLDAQISAQSEEAKAAKRTALDAQNEIDSLKSERQKLLSQWHTALIGMQRRDEAHAALKDALQHEQDEILTMETTLNTYKTSIQKEEEENEKLTFIWHKSENEISTVKKHLAQCRTKYEALKQEYNTCSRILSETESGIGRVTIEKNMKDAEMRELQKRIERGAREKISLEDSILETLQEKLTLDKAAQHTAKIAKKVREKIQNLEQQIVEIEHQTSEHILRADNARNHTDSLKKSLQDLEDEFKKRSDAIDRSRAEINRRVHIIEHKQGQIDNYNKKIQELILQAGGEELSPYEVLMKSLQKSIDQQQHENMEQEQQWLRLQHELVQLAKDKDAEVESLEQIKVSTTIAMQRKIRVENQISSLKAEIAKIEKRIKNTRNEMKKFNNLYFKENALQDTLERSNQLMEADFINTLKEAEMESIQMQAKFDSIKEEKERLLNNLVEAEQQIMLWEKKTQLAKETKNAVDTEIGQGEIKAMRSEIHRMEVRHGQLMKQQEKMIQEMEKSVSRRETIYTRGEAQMKLQKKVVTKADFQRSLAELKRKIKLTSQDAKSCEDEMLRMRDAQTVVGEELDGRQTNVQKLQSTVDTMEGDVEYLLEQKQKHLMELISLQQRSKYYQQLKSGKYVRLCKNDEALETELDKQLNKLQTMNAIVERVGQEFPLLQPSLRSITLSLQTRLASDETSR